MDAASVKEPDLDELTFLLSLVARERAARNNTTLWKMNLDAAVEEHGEACEAVWSELYRMLDRIPVAAAKPSRPEVIKQGLKRDMKRELKSALRNVIDQMVDDL
jgi:hypothetical protein